MEKIKNDDELIYEIAQTFDSEALHLHAHIRMLITRYRLDMKDRNIRAALMQLALDMKNNVIIYGGNKRL